MLLRLHFTAEDLARVDVAPVPDPLWETTLGLQQLLTTPRTIPAALRAWRRRARSMIEERRLWGLIRLLAPLVPVSGYYPDFLTPPEAAGGLAAGLDAIRATPLARVRQETHRLTGATAPPRTAWPWLRGLVRGDRDRMADLTGALRTAHELLTTPIRDRAEAQVEADRARRARALRDGGVHALLESLSPAARWQPPVLYVNYPVDRDVHLAGRGLRLIPSYFCSHTAIALADPALGQVLVLPAHSGGPDIPPDDPPPSLVALLGRTRARVLVAVRATVTTGELAARLGVSPASASEHVHVLTAAGLVRSHRSGNRVLHTLTPLGAALASDHQSENVLLT